MRHDCLVTVRDCVIVETTTFYSAEELTEYFRAHGGDVDRRSGPKMRTHDQKELFNLGQYLPTLAANGLLRFPLTLEKGESPDFVLTDGNSEVWGLEVTEATTEDFQRELTDTEGEEAEEFELYRGGPSVGDSPEREACTAILSAGKRKAKKVRQGKYRPLPRYDLLIYVSVRADFYKPDEAMHLLLRCAPQRPALWSGLGQVSIIANSHLYHDVTGNLVRLPFFSLGR